MSLIWEILPGFLRDSRVRSPLSSPVFPIRQHHHRQQTRPIHSLYLHGLLVTSEANCSSVIVGPTVLCGDCVTKCVCKGFSSSSASFVGSSLRCDAREKSNLSALEAGAEKPGSRAEVSVTIPRAFRPLRRLGLLLFPLSSSPPSGKRFKNTLSKTTAGRQVTRDPLGVQTAHSVLPELRFRWKRTRMMEGLHGREVQSRIQRPTTE